jgi:Zn-dependent protease with chaperone function
MDNEQTTSDILSNEILLRSIKRNFGDSPISLMTAESHPEMINHYHQLCEEKNNPKRPIIVAESNIVDLYVTPSLDYIIVSRAWINSRTPEQLAADFGHEEHHIYLKSKKSFKLAEAIQTPKSLLISAIGMRGMYDALSALTEKLFSDVHPPHDPMKGWPLLLASPLIIHLGAVIIRNIDSRKEEYLCDKASAEFAGIEAAISSLLIDEKITPDSESYSKNPITRLDKILFTYRHPSNYNRIQFLRNEFRDELKNSEYRER